MQYFKRRFGRKLRVGFRHVQHLIECASVIFSPFPRLTKPRGDGKLTSTVSAEESGVIALANSPMESVDAVLVFSADLYTPNNR